MLGVQILAVGGLKETFYAEACREYGKRLGAYCRLHVTELPEAKLAKQLSLAQIAGSVEAEGAAMLQKLPPRSYVVALCIEGKQMTSQGLAGLLGEVAGHHPEITFLIGGSNGLSEAVKARAHLRLSMSGMTFPHQLARVMLLEQIYRGFSINNGGKYHK